MESRRNGFGVGGGALSAAHGGALLVPLGLLVGRSDLEVSRVSKCCVFCVREFASFATVKALEPVLTPSWRSSAAYRRSFHAVLGRIKRF